MKLRRTIGFACLLALFALPSPSGPAAEVIAEGFMGGEGPAWSPDGYLIFSDTNQRKIFRYDPGKGISVFREESHGANGNAFDKQGRLYTCEYISRRVTRTDRNGNIEVVADRYQGKRFNAPNDIVIRGDGHVYFTDPLFTPLEERDLDFYGVYHLKPDGELELIAKPEGRPNGITLSPDESILYVGITDERSVWAYDVARSGSVSNGRVFISGLAGGPDGIKTDELGNLYVTSRGIQIYSPDGQWKDSIELPGGARNCAFGDDDRRTLYMTGRTTLYRARLNVRGARE